MEPLGLIMMPGQGTFSLRQRCHLADLPLTGLITHAAMKPRPSGHAFIPVG